MTPVKPVKNQIIVQNDAGYRYSIEPFLLADFAPLLPGHEVLDIGTGCGIIPLLMIHREPELQITGVEIQDSAVAIAKQNVSNNKMEIKIVSGDFLDKDVPFTAEQFDLIVSNPPYRKVNSGRMNPDQGKAIARHELKLNLPNMLEKAKTILKNGGHITLSYPPIRLQETLRELENRELFPSRIRFIHGNNNAEAKIFLIDAIKGKKSDLIVDSPLYVYNRDGSYTKEMQEIYDSFNCVDGTDHIGKK
ncbi:MAG: methyltransferase [Nitrospinae bacterium]|nr:methyltransferase [Nitrospinota bacterium]